MKILGRRGTLANISEETRRKMSESAKRRCQSEEWLTTQRRRGTDLDISLFKKLYYDENMTQQEVADEMGVSQKTIFKFMRRNNLPARKAAKRYQRMEKNSSWKGGKRINEQGYVEIYMPEYPHTRANGYVREHIYVAEQCIGRPLLFYSPGDGRNEVVHHINGVKTDNRPENLLVLTASQHQQLHMASSKESVDDVLLSRIRQLESELHWERCNGKGTALWASEIEEFPIAVTKARFPE